MKNFSAANAELSLSCQWWLSDEAEWEETKQTPAMREGNAGHEMIERRLNGLTVGYPSVLEKHMVNGPVARARVVAKYNQWLDWLDGRLFDTWRPEVALAFNVRSLEARELPPREEGRGCAQYADVDRTCEVTIKCDVLGEGADHDGPYVEVIDWKFGRQNDKDHRQVLVGCAAASQIAGIDRAIGRVVYISETDVTVDSREYDAFDLAAIGRRLGEVFDSVHSGHALPVLGAHCRTMYCRAMKSCSKKLIGGGT